MSEKAKPNLSLLKNLVSELEKSVELAYAINEKTDNHGYIAELARASGLASGVMMEAKALVGDAYRLITVASSGLPQSTEGDLLDLFGSATNPKRNAN